MSRKIYEQWCHVVGIMYLRHGLDKDNLIDLINNIFEGTYEKNNRSNACGK